jgi:hypothetical protein
MSVDEPCSTVRELLPEVALGTATGEERARVLQHLARCAPCRGELAELAEVADELQLLFPAHEPPVGFESRVVRALFGDGPRRLWPRVAAAAAAAAGLVALSAGAVYLATADDRELAAQVRETLAVADGDYFAAATLRSPSGDAAGTVFGYQGEPSWIFIVCDTAPSRTFRISVTLEHGRSRLVGEMTVAGGSGTWGGSMPIDVHDVSAVTLRAEAGRGILQARL